MVDSAADPLSEDSLPQSDEEPEAAAISVPVANFPARPIEKSPPQSGKSRPLKDNVFTLTDDELQEVLKDPQSKKALLDKLLAIKPATSKPKTSSTKAKAAAVAPPASSKPLPPHETEPNFEKAYSQVVLLSFYPLIVPLVGSQAFSH